MLLKRLYPYREIERVTLDDGTRYYVCPDTGAHLTSVTTILSATEDKTKLLEWEARVGAKKAQDARDEATGLGSLMHEHLEKHIMGIDRPRGNNLVRQMAQRMADTIIARGLCDVDEVWGVEVALHFPELYAGTTDLVGVYKGKPAIMDFKTAKKIKKKADIPNYFCQLAAYALAHNLLFDTNIQTGVIFMVSRDCEFVQYVIEGVEFDDYCGQWHDRVVSFHQKMAA